MEEEDHIKCTHKGENDQECGHENPPTANFCGKCGHVLVHVERKQRVECGERGRNHEFEGRIAFQDGTNTLYRRMVSIDREIVHYQESVDGQWKKIPFLKIVKIDIDVEGIAVRDRTAIRKARITFWDGNVRDGGRMKVNGLHYESDYDQGELYQATCVTFRLKTATTAR